MKGVGVLLPMLVLAVVLSALGVVYAKHQSRKLFIALQSLEAARDEMNIEWGQLQLEQSTWAAHARIEKLAREKLAMRPPLPGQVIAIEERP